MYPFGSRGMSASTGRAERSESLGFTRDCITPVATACVSSPGTRTLTSGLGNSFVQRVMERIAHTAVLMEAPTEPGSFRTLNCICSDSYHEAATTRSRFQLI